MVSFEKPPQQRLTNIYVAPHIIRQVKAKFITGLSATLVRKDGRHPIIMMRCGSVLHRLETLPETKGRFHNCITY